MECVGVLGGVAGTYETFANSIVCVSGIVYSICDWQSYLGRCCGHEDAVAAAVIGGRMVC